LLPRRIYIGDDKSKYDKEKVMGSLMQVQNTVQFQGFWAGSVAPGLAALAFRAGLRPVGADFAMMNRGGRFTLVPETNLPGHIADAVHKDGVWRGRVAPGMADELYRRGVRPVTLAADPKSALDKGGLVELRPAHTFAVSFSTIAPEGTCFGRGEEPRWARGLKPPVLKVESRLFGTQEFQVLVPFTAPGVRVL